MPVTWVLDLSNHQGDFDVARAVGEGYGAVICKATEGASFRDGRFGAFTAAAAAHGAIPGAYHFLRAGDGAAQARAFHARVAAAGGPVGWLIALDNEADATWSDTMHWAAEWSRLTGSHPFLMYSGAWWWGPRGWPGATLTPHLWHSRYVTGSGPGSTLYGAVPESWWSPGYGGWAQATLLQFTSQAQVAGQRVDVSAFRGTREQLLALTRPASSGGVMTRAERLIEAWDGGFDVTTEGEHCELTVRQRRADDFQAHVAEVLDRLAARPGGSVVLGEADRSAIIAGVTAGVAAEVVSQIAPALRQVAQLADRLGAAGDALGALNDPAPGGV